MDKNIVELYKEYGEYSNSYRAFPLLTDGLKPVERRIMFSVFQLASDKLTKCARIVGDVIGKYHPHGDQSAYQSLVGLVHRGILVDQGNFGSNIGVEPTDAAAMRYTETKLQPFIKKMCFEHIKSVPWFDNDLGEREPSFLPTMFPICFLGDESVQGIGFGYRSVIPTYDIHDLYKRLKWLLGIEKNEPIIKPSTNCDVISDKKELKKLLTTGEGSISVRGKIKEEPHNCKVHLLSWSSSKSFQSILSFKSLEALMANGDIGYSDLSANGKTNILFEVIRKKNRDDLYNKLIKSLNDAITSTIHYKTVVVDINRKVKVESIDSMLMQTYNMYVEANKKSIQIKIEGLKNKLNEIKILQKIKPCLSKVLTYSLMSFEEKVDAVSQQSGVDIDIIKDLFHRHNINKLLKIDTETKDVEEQIKIENDTLKNINDFVLAKYKWFEKGDSNVSD